ncbi:MAG: hypothetical protein ACR2M3_09530 [Thermomicrobiales bacterium]
MKNGRANDEQGRVLAAMELARRFHDTYARLAPTFGEEAHTESEVRWGGVSGPHKRLMVAVCYEIQRGDEAGFAPLRDVVMGVKQAWDGVCACHEGFDGDEVADPCGAEEDRFDAAIAHLVAVLDGDTPDGSQDATWGMDGHR